MRPALPERRLRAGRVRLEPLRPAHAERLFDQLQAPQLYEYIPGNAPGSVQELASRYERWSAGGSDDGSEVWLNYAIYRPAHRDYVGTVQATIYASGAAYIAYEVFPRLWRRHYATVACTTLIAHIFACHDHVGVVSALLDTRNVASYRLLESLGFRRTGTIENADWFKGKSSDEYAYEITRTEFFATLEKKRRAAT